MKRITEPTAPPLLVSRIGKLYSEMFRGCDRVFREKGFPLDLDQVPVLLKLYYSGGAYQQEICSDLNRDKASVNRTVAFLLKNDIVQVSQDATDKRKTRVELTENGTMLAIRGHQILEEFEVSLSYSLTAAEKKQFLSITQRLIEDITSTQ